MAKVQQKYETNNEEETTQPERDLWVAVLTRAVLDAVKGPPHLDLMKPSNLSHHSHYLYDHNQARHFFLEGGKHFRMICEMAGRNPDYVQQKIKKVLLRKGGWNVDVPITSHYRQGAKRGQKRGKYKRKKTLTGNSYYAAKAAKGPKNFYYQDMGKKGGRPRIYNRIVP